MARDQRKTLGSSRTFLGVERNGRHEIELADHGISCGGRALRRHAICYCPTVQDQIDYHCESRFGLHHTLLAEPESAYGLIISARMGYAYQPGYPLL